MTNPVKNFNWLKYPYGDCTQWFAESKGLYKLTTAHNGIDIVRPHGEHLFACEGGTVTDVKDDPSGYGKHVRIRTKQDRKGIMRDWVYGHMHFIAVKEGQEIPEGKFIGTMGNTGFVVSDQKANGFWDYNPYRGTHLHLGVRDVVKKDGKILALDYENGYFGRYDPLPLFAKPRALTTALVADKHNSKRLWTLAQLLVKIGL